MKKIATFIVCLGLATTIAFGADKQSAPVQGEIVQLNKPGTILVELSVGADDGVKTGDTLIVSRKDKRIAKLKIAKCESNRSTANIVDVQAGESLQIHDRVANAK